MKFNCTNPFEVFQESPIFVPEHFATFNLSSDYQTQLISQDWVSFSQENSSTMNNEPATNQNPVNNVRTRKEWQPRKGSSFLTKNRNKEAVGIKNKNFLVNMKRFFFEWLQIEMENLYYELETKNDFLRTLRQEKIHMSMRDYEEFFKIKEIQVALAKCFRTGHLYRELMLSRARPQNKKRFLKKIRELEEAFRTKELKELTPYKKQRHTGNLPYRPSGEGDLASGDKLNK